MLRLYKRSKYVAKNKALEEKEIFYESQYYDDQVNKTKRSKIIKPKDKEIFSQEHTGIYKKNSDFEMIDLDATPEPMTSNTTLNQSDISRKITFKEFVHKLKSHLTSFHNKEVTRKENSGSICCIFEKDDGIYDDSYSEIDWDQVNMPLVIGFEFCLCVIVLLLLYFLYDVTSKIFEAFEFVALYDDALMILI